MADNGYCPSGRLFEAAACGATIVTDEWEGLNLFFEPGVEILIAKQSEDVISALQRSPEELARIGRAARERALEEHTADVRAIEMENIMNSFRHVSVEVS
jgi:spore maturation protein CgeB